MATLAVPAAAAAAAPLVASMSSNRVQQDGGRVTSVVVLPATSNSNFSLASLHHGRDMHKHRRPLVHISPSPTARWLQVRGSQLQEKLQNRRNSEAQEIQYQSSRAQHPHCSTWRSRLQQRVSSSRSWLGSSLVMPSSLRGFNSTRRPLSKRPIFAQFGSTPSGVHVSTHTSHKNINHTAMTVTTCKEWHSVRPPVRHNWSLPGSCNQQLKKPFVSQHELVQNCSKARQRSGTRIQAQDEDFEVDDTLDYDMDLPDDEEEDEGDQRDYETDYDMPVGEYPVQESETFMSTEGVEEERVVDYKIDEEEFHKLSLYDCDFFIRKVPDPDNDVYDFREMYVTPPDTDVYAIPKVIGNMPKKPLRCMKSNYYYVEVTEPPVDTPRAPLSKTEYLSMKIFLIKHLRNVKTDDDDFILDFEEIYVIDSATKSIKRADVKVEVKRGKDRDRTAETLIVRDDGNTFRLIPTELKSTPDEVIGEVQWERTRENMENYLRGFRDYEKSNWF